MAQPRSELLHQSAFGVLMLVVGLGSGLLPKTSEASCGDYLAAHQVHSSTPLDREPLHTPCHSPGCRNSIPPTAPSPPASVEPTTDQWACAQAGNFEWPVLFEPYTSLERVHGLDGYPVRSEKPPRSLCAVLGR